MDRPARSPIARSFERHMRAQNRSERTIATYLQGLRQAEAFLRKRPDRARCTDERERATLRPTTLEAATRTDLEAFIPANKEGLRRSTAWPPPPSRSEERCPTCSRNTSICCTALISRGRAA